MNNEEHANRKVDHIAPVVMVDGVQCIPVPLTTRIAKATAGLASIESDLSLVAECLENLLEGSRKIPRHIAWALYTSSVTTYGKCFARAKGRSAMLNRSDLPKNLRSAHDAIIHERNNFTAHAGETLSEFRSVFAALHPNRERPSVETVGIFNGVSVQPGNEDIAKLQNLVMCLVDVVTKRIESNMAKIEEWIALEDPTKFYPPNA